MHVFHRVRIQVTSYNMHTTTTTTTFMVCYTGADIASSRDRQWSNNTWKQDKKKGMRTVVQPEDERCRWQHKTEMDEDICQRGGRTDDRPLLRSLHWLPVKHRVTYRVGQKKVSQKLITITLSNL